MIEKPNIFDPKWFRAKMSNGRLLGMLKYIEKKAETGMASNKTKIKIEGCFGRAYVHEYNEIIYGEDVKKEMDYYEILSEYKARIENEQN